MAAGLVSRYAPVRLCAGAPVQLCAGPLSGLIVAAAVQVSALVAVSSFARVVLLSVCRGGMACAGVMGACAARLLSGAVRGL